MPEKKKAATKKRLPTNENPPPEPEDGIQDDGSEIEPDRDKPLPDTSEEVGD